MNPGPFTVEQEQVLRSLPKIQDGQDKVIEALKDIKANQKVADDELTEITTRLAAIERDVGDLKELRADFQQLKSENSSLAAQLDRVERRQDDLENRSRRNNLVFYGLKDLSGESWEDCERPVLSLCSDHLGVQVTSSDIERAHRLRRMSPRTIYFYENGNSENDQLRAKQAELEYMQRRYNLLFYGLPDAQSVSWAQSEEKLINVHSPSLKVPPSEILVERAHRLGGFSSNKCRSIIAKFSSFKLKQQIRISSSKLKEENITVSEDYSPATRLARKKLSEFGKTQSSSFKLRFNKLHINKKCYIYSPSDDCVREISGAFKPSAETSGIAHKSPNASVSPAAE
ncbi:uncharacterized protein LOC119392168 [Rhipicephalus sanguineus]|uniref:uncharacterized protein LOC119392168 n=1 Tax=Rhipicephalus sanguineus TaxID=34632 RepID=UPI001893B322|nr:uncharacterized protein LOC119392168 [Rhipicephalus sanguineus]